LETKIEMKIMQFVALTASTLYAAGLFSAKSEAQTVLQETACERLNPIPGPLGYQLRDDGARCEGLYDPLVAGVAADLIDLSIRSTEALDPAEDISVSAQATTAKIRVVGRSMLADSHYRVDLKLDRGGEVAVIPIDTVLKPAEIDPNQIGFTAYVDGVLTPVIVKSSSHPDPNDTGYVVTLRFGQSNDRLAWRWQESCGIQNDWTEVPSFASLPGEPVAIKVSRPLRDNCSLSVLTHSENGEWSEDHWLIGAR
jgi:hypothetical protein